VDHGQNEALQLKTRGRLRLTGLGAWAWPTWGRGARHVRRALDVGLDFSLPFYQEKGRKNLHFIFVE
jgi:hypothetical protein